MSRENAPRSNGDSCDLPLLPDGWCWCELGQLAAWEPNSITDGPFGSNLKTEHYTESGPRVIRLQNIGDGFFRDVHAHISEDRYNNLQKHRAYSNDLVIAALGEELPRACLIPHWLGPAIVKADCIRLKPETSAAIPKFLTFALNSPGTRKRTATIIHGVGRPRLNLGEIKAIVVPLAPVNEQRRIVQKIEELFSKLDAGVAALERVKAALKRYRAAVLKAAVEGKQTAEWRTHHPAKETGAQLLQRILDERRRKWEQEQRAKYAKAGKQLPNGWQAKYEEPTGPETSGLPALPEGWCWATVEQLTDSRQNSLTDGPFGSKLKTAHYTTEGPRVIRLQNIGDGCFNDEIAHISWEHFRTLAKHRVFAGDVVIAALGETLPRACIIPAHIGEAIVKADCIRFKPAESFVSANWASFALNADPTRSRAIIHGVGRPRLNLQDIRSLALPIPPMEEQKFIAGEVERRFSIVEEVEVEVEASLKRASRLRQSILKRAFEGRLVPQDPRDEPAEKLLERIRRQRQGVTDNGEPAGKRRSPSKRRNDRSALPKET